MASVLLRAAGTALGGPIGGFIGATVGAFVDSSIFGSSTEDVEGPRAGEFRINGADEGDPMPFFDGIEGRVNTNVIWLGGIEEVRNTEEVGGKGIGGSSTVSSYEYFADFAIQINEIPSGALRGLISNGQIIYLENPSITDTFGASIVPVIPSSDIANGVIRTADIIATTTPDAGGPDLSRYLTGFNIDVTGFLGADMTGTFRVIQATESRLRIEAVQGNTGGTFTADGPRPGVIVTQNLSNELQGIVEEVVYYSGNQVAPSPLIEASEGVGNVQAYVDRTYATLEGYNSTRAGWPPQVEAFASGRNTTLAGVIAQILARSGVPSSAIDTSLVTGDCRFYSVQGPNKASDSIKAILAAYDLLDQEQGEQVRFFPRTQAHVHYIDFEDIGYAEGDQEPPEPLEFEDKANRELPAQVTVRYLDSFNRYLRGARSTPHGSFDGTGTQVIDFPLAFRPGEATAIALRTMWQQHNEREPIKLILPIDHSDIRANDVVRFHDGSQPYEALVNSSVVLPSQLVELDVTPIVGDSSFQDQEADESNGEIGFSNPQGNVIAEPHDGPPFDDVPGDEPGIYLTATNTDPNDAWTGAQVWASDDDIDYTLFSLIEERAIMGRALTVLPSGPSGVWDDVSTVDVELFDGSLSSKTDEEVLKGRNLLSSGTGEFFSFANAQLIAPKTYRLSRLLRGLGNSSSKSGSHVLGETISYFNGGGVKFQNFPAASIGLTKYIKVVAPGKDLASVISRQITLLPTSVQPFPVFNVQWHRDVSNLGGLSSANIELTWQRSSRLPSRPLNNPVPLLEPSEEYEIDVIHPAGSGAVVSTKLVSGQRVFEYDYQQQLLEGITPADAIDFQIRQVGDLASSANSTLIKVTGN